MSLNPSFQLLLHLLYICAHPPSASVRRLQGARPYVMFTVPCRRGFTPGRNLVVVCLYLHVTSAAPLVKALTNASGPAKSALSLLLSSLSFVPPWRSKVEVAEAPDSHGASRIMTQLDDLVNDMSHTYDFRRQFMKPLEAMAYEREFTKQVANIHCDEDWVTGAPSLSEYAELSKKYGKYGVSFGRYQCEGIGPTTSSPLSERTGASQKPGTSRFKHVTSLSSSSGSVSRDSIHPSRFHGERIARRPCGL
ncbi:hypothetical protein SeMB42_g07329 [Synchytrium endobioticum]|uniref:Uncharacterized protein n=1 Tax=Synchytrium endobioticum TaxID=286115 RepID=A0A507C4V1_9FUNG|nr:hypothetical protein SeMB42_g07329 [Synchytrium endobioticum]